MPTATHTEKTFKSSIDIPQRARIIEILNARPKLRDPDRTERLRAYVS